MADPIPNSSEASPALEMRNVAVIALRDPKWTVLRGVDWTVRAGEFWAVAGLLRSGKSDLLSVAAGITQPSEGTYRVFGQELLSGFEREQLSLRLRIGLVFDGGHLLQDLTLAENISLPLSYHLDHLQGDPRERLNALLAFTGLESWAQSFPGEMNRNWQQRIGLARALALKPDVLLLDSPLAGLDPLDAEWWLNMISELSAGHAILDRRPVTLVVTGDDLRPWQDRADRFAVLRNRELVVVGERASLHHHPEPALRDLLLRREPLSESQQEVEKASSNRVH